MNASLPASLSIAFIGGGNMATAIVGGLLKQGVAPSQLLVVDPTEAARERMASLGARTLAQADASLAQAQVVVWAVKPQQFKEAAQACAAHTSQALHYSVMAGLRTADMAKWLGTPRVVRAMPNTPALVGLGMTGLYAGVDVTDEERALVSALVAPTGQSMWLPQEADLDAVTALSGSGPAYVFYVLEAMIAAAEKLGLSSEQGRTLALATLGGATELARQSSDSPATLRQNVTSKGGTTYAAITTLEERGVKAAVMDAIEAAHKRAGELGDEFGR
jgi:pyrroline-5-carboxylate reductase